MTHFSHSKMLLCLSYLLFHQTAIILTKTSVCDAVVCEMPPEMRNETHSTYTCPRPFESKAHTECCKSGCCVRSRYFYEIKTSLALVIALMVIFGCLIILLVTGICCFYAGCPLYTACRMEMHAELATYDSKDDCTDTDSMPPEYTKKNGNKFTPIVLSSANLPLDNNCNV